MISLVKKFWRALFHKGPIYTLRAIYHRLITESQTLNRLKLRFYIFLHNKSYSHITSLAARLNHGKHPKRKILNYEKFFFDQINANDSVLDVGCHEGYLSALLAQKAKNVIGIDTNPFHVKKAATLYSHINNLRFLVGDATTYDFGDKKFNKIILSNVLEHINRRIDFLKNLNRLADIILIRVPLITRDWLAVYKKQLGFEYRLASDHFIEYTPEILVSEASASGWRLDRYSIQFGELWGILSKNLKGEKNPKIHGQSTTKNEI